MFEPVQSSAGWRVLVTILDKPVIGACDTALLSEQALTGDWSRPEEEGALPSVDEDGPGARLPKSGRLRKSAFAP